MINVERKGSGAPLLLIHGLGGNIRSWRTIDGELARQREVIAIDLPGHGASPAEADSGTFKGLADSVERYIAEQGLSEVDLVGSSMGARLVLELGRRGHRGRIVALDPGGFWRGWERGFFKTTIGASVKLLRAVKAALPTLSRNPASRTLLLAQFSTRPWALDGAAVADELHSYAITPTFDALVRDLATGPEQSGPAAPTSGAVTIGWGRHDRLCLTRQARRAMVAFPSARLHWFEHSGHFPMWDEPDATIQLILGATP